MIKPLKLCTHIHITYKSDIILTKSLILYELILICKYLFIIIILTKVLPYNLRLLGLKSKPYGMSTKHNFCLTRSQNNY